MLKAKDIMTKNVTTISKDASVKKLCELLTKNMLSGLPVVDKDKRLVGFVSERDVIPAVVKKDFLNKKVKNIMTKKVFYLKASTSTEEVSKIFTEKPFRVLPIIQNNKVVGVISRKDVIGRLLGQYY